MRETAGRVIDYRIENRPVPGCTVSKQLHNESGVEIYIFSLAAGTSISAECYDRYKLIYVLEGDVEVYSAEGFSQKLTTGETTVTPRNIPVGMKSETGGIYLELSIGKEKDMNQVLNAGEVFRLAELLPYREGQIVNIDLASNEKMKFVLMSFDEGTGLSEHAAPGDALVFALDGEAVIGYEGKEYTVRAGETFKFDKFGRHSVKAACRFKMALLLVFD